MVVHPTNGEHLAVHVSKEAIEIATQIEQARKIIQKNRVAGNGSIVITLKVVGGKLRDFFDLSFPGLSEKKAPEKPPQKPKRQKRTS
jgi:hypothetical protein